MTKIVLRSKFVLMLLLILPVFISCKDDAEEELIPVTASFTSPDTAVNQGSEVTFTDTSTGTVNQRLWTIEGGTPSSSTEENPTIIFQEAGIFEVNLTVANVISIDEISIQVLVLPTEGLIIHLPMSNDANDLSGNSNNGSVMGATLTQNRKGTAGEAYSFDGIDDQITFNFDQQFNQIATSYSFWIKFREFKAAVLGNDVVDNVQTGVSFTVGQGTTTLNKLAINYGNGGSPRSSSRRTFVADQTLETDTWYHVVGIIENFESMKIFINGIESEGFVTGTANSFQHSNSGGSIGRTWDPNSFFSGEMDDFRIFNKALSEVEIQVLNME